MSERRRCVLEAEQIGFAVLRREDIPAMTKWFENFEYSSYLGMLGRLVTLEDETGWFERHASQNDLNVTFGILELETSRLIGTCSLMDINHQRQTATLGIGIGETDCWNKGYGMRAVRLLVEYGMYFKNLYNIKLEYYDFNLRGARAYEKAGFRFAGRRRGALQIGGERFDDITMDITRDEVDLSRMRAVMGLSEKT